MVEDTRFDSHGTRCAAWYLRAETDALTGDRGRPCVLMAHGFGATKDAGLLPFAERFAAAGADVLVFDYRGYGLSEGTPRQDVAHLKHRQDYHSAIAHARGLPGVDPERIVLWGSSYSGGHVVPVAAKDGQVAAVISQGAAMDGLVALLKIRRWAGVGQRLKLTGHALWDVVGSLLGRAPHLIPVVGPPGTLAAITAEGAETGYRSIMGPTFRNEMCARGAAIIPLNRPVRSASKLRAPIFLVVAERDNICPPAAVRAVARKAGACSEVLELDCGHFDIYTGGPFERSSTAQVAFLEKVLKVSAPIS